jgi:hypothetical protein
MAEAEYTANEGRLNRTGNIEYMFHVPNRITRGRA